MLVLALAFGCAVGSGDHLYDADGDGYVNADVDGDDCDDRNAQVNPGAQEICADGIDNNCDGVVDDDGAGSEAWFRDADGDGHGAGEIVWACTKPEGMVTLDDDCDDANKGISPSHSELCNDGADNDCDGGPGDCLLTGTVSAQGLIATTINDRDLSGGRLEVFDSDGDGSDDILVPSNSNEEVRLHRGPLGETESGADSVIVFSGRAGEPFEVQLVGDLDGNGIEDVVMLSRDEFSSAFVGVYLAPFIGGGFLSQPDSRPVVEGPESTPQAVVSTNLDGVEHLWVGGVENREVISIEAAPTTPLDWDSAEVITPPPEQETFGAVLSSLPNGAVLASAGWSTWALYPSGETEPTSGLLAFPVDFVSHGPIAAVYDSQDVLLVGSPGRLTDQHPLTSDSPGSAHLVPLPQFDTVDASSALVSFNGTSSLFGWSVVSLDFNGDGLQDFAIGEPDFDGGESRVYIFYGPVAPGEHEASNASVVIENAQQGGLFGYQLYAGDTNGDGADDLVVDTVGGGRVYVINGSGL